jgi:TM2 domain-containing membrane protein YozV
MFCRTCGKDVNPGAVACIGCGVPPLVGKKFCQACGVKTMPEQVLCTQCGVSLIAVAPGAKNKVAAGVLGIVLGGLGIHKFYLGYTKEGIIMLVVSVATLGIGYAVMYVIGLIEGVIYLTKSDAEFEAIYVKGRKPWF